VVLLAHEVQSDKPNVLLEYKLNNMPIFEDRSNLIEAFYSDKKAFLATFINDPVVEKTLKKISEVLEQASVTFAIYGEECTYESISCAESMVCGPAYCSEKHPQPVDSIGVGFFPVLQIDLEWLGSITNRKFRKSMLQFWWSFNDRESVILEIPLSEIDLNNSLNIDFSQFAREDVETWIPFDWPCRQDYAFKLTGGAAIGVTYPSFDALLEEIPQKVLAATFNDEKLDLLYKLAANDSYVNSVTEIGFIFNLFGFYKSHACAPWEDRIQQCFLHIQNWCNVMYGNIFMEIDADGYAKNFVFHFGR
jgi:hypothetical protein